MLVPTVVGLAHRLGPTGVNHNSVTVDNLLTCCLIFSRLHEQDRQAASPELMRFLRAALGFTPNITETLVKVCNLIHIPTEDDIKMVFVKHGLVYNFSYRNFKPIFTTCPFCPSDAQGHGHPLGREVWLKGVAYDSSGPTPILWAHRSCSKCQTQFYPNYYVGTDRIRHYTPPSPAYERTGYLHVSQTTFVSEQLAYEWDNSNFYYRASRQHQAVQYNMSHSNKQHLFPIEWKTTCGYKLSSKTIWSTFYLHALLRHLDSIDATLQVPHDGEDEKRFDEAIRERNVAHNLLGTVYQQHACDLCCREYCVLVKDDLANLPHALPPGRSTTWYGDYAPYWDKWEKQGDGMPVDGNLMSDDEANAGGFVKKYIYLRCVVGDGVTLTRNRCAFMQPMTNRKGKIVYYAACKNPLVSVKDQYCAAHHGEEKKCRADGCERLRPQNFWTCDDPAHRGVEMARDVSKNSIVALAPRVFRNPGRSDDMSTLMDDEGNMMEHAQEVDQTQAEGDSTGKDEFDIRALDADSDSDSSDSDEDEDDDEVTAEDENKAKKRKPLGPRVIMHRVRTGCEFLLVAPCGVILRRTTMIKHEGIATVKTILERTFPNDRSMPSIFFYDSNCLLSKHLRKEGLIGPLATSSFRGMSLIVDPFHFTCKHKKTDAYCQTNCNPEAVRCLYDDKGKWVFNSSICEQTNSWFGGFQAIVRELKEDKYDFYLDQLTLIHNEGQVQGLAQGAKAPRLFNFEHGVAL